MADDAPVNGLPAWDPTARASRVINDPAELERQFQAGKLHLVSDHEYPVVGSDGKVWSMPASGVQKALADGFHLASAKDVARAEARTAGGQLRTLADGALDGITFGGGAALQAAAGADKLGLQARREENPGIHMAGMLGGGAALALASDGASLGGLAEAGAARMIGTEAAATSLGRMGVMAAGGAAEGAAFGVGDNVSEAVLGDAPLAADSLIASGLHGAVWGGAGGALLGKAFGRAKVKPTGEEINAAAANMLGEAPPKQFGQKVVDLLDRVGAHQAEAGGNSEFAEVLRGTPEARKRFLDMAQTPKVEMQAKARELADLVERRVADHQGVQSSMRLESAFDDATTAHLEADAALKAARADGLTGDELKAAVQAKREAEANLAELKVQRDRFASENAAIEDLRGDLGIDAKGKVDVAKVESFVGSITRPRADARMDRLRMLVDHEPVRSYGGGGQRILPGELEAQRTGADAKRLGALLDDIGERQGASNLLRDQLGREQSSGMDNELLAGVVGHGVAGYPGALAARELASNATRPAHAFIARYQRAALVQRVHGYVRDQLDRFVAGPVKAGVEEAQAAGRRYGFDRTLARSTQAMFTGNREDRRKAAAARIAELNSLDEGGMADLLEQSTADTQEHLPDVSAVIRQRLADAHNVLRSVVPQPLASAGAGGGLVPKASPGMLHDRDIRRFAHVDAAIQDPLRIVDELAKGNTPDPAAVLAVQTAYPALWGKVVREFGEAMARNPEKVGWRQAMSMAVTLGITSHPSLELSSLNLQQALAKPKAPIRPGPVSKSLGQAHDRALSGAAATLNDHLMERGAAR